LLVGVLINSSARVGFRSDLIHQVSENWRWPPTLGSNTFSSSVQSGRLDFPVFNLVADLQGNVVLVRARLKNRPDAIIEISLEVVGNGVFGVVLRSEARAIGQPGMSMKIDQHGHHELAGEIDASRTLYRF